MLAVLQVQGLSGEAMQAQIAQLQQTFSAAATSAAAGAGKGEQEQLQEEEEEGRESAASLTSQPPRQQQWAVEQLCALCKLPAAGMADRRAVLQFLALHAFVQLDPKAVAKVRVRSLGQLNWWAGWRGPEPRGVTT